MADNKRVYDNLKEMVEEEISTIVKKGELDEKCLNHLDKLVDIVKDLDTISAMHEYGEDGYSNMYPMYYDDGSSYARKRDSMGRYSRENRGGYYRDGYSGDMREKLERMLDDAQTPQERDAIRTALGRM